MKITIPTPCHEDWNKMTPDQQGRFCSSCSKTVVDFTAMGKDEITAYFTQKKEENTCGRFLNTQLTPPENNTYSFFDNRLRRFAVALYIVFGFTLFSCNEPIDEHTVGDVEHIVENKEDTLIKLKIDTIVDETNQGSSKSAEIKTKIVGDVIVHDTEVLGGPILIEEKHSKGEVVVKHTGDTVKNCSKDSTINQHSTIRKGKVKIKE